MLGSAIVLLAALRRIVAAPDHLAWVVDRRDDCRFDLPARAPAAPPGAPPIREATLA